MARQYPVISADSHVTEPPNAYVDNIEERASEAQVTRYIYDAAGRQTYSVDAVGAVTQFEYDAAGRVVARRELVNQVPTGSAIKISNSDGQWHAMSKPLGTFKAGDTVTATVRFKASAGLAGTMFLGDAGGPDPYDNNINLSLPGDGGWQTLTLTRTMSHDDSMWVYLYDQVASADPGAGVVYDNLRVSSAARGEVLAEDF